MTTETIPAFPCTSLRGEERAAARRVWDWMLRNAAEHDDNATSLAEAAADEFDMADLGGCLDDPDHWIWELAAEALPAD